MTVCTCVFCARDFLSLALEPNVKVTFASAGLSIPKVYRQSVGRDCDCLPLPRCLNVCVNLTLPLTRNHLCLGREHVRQGYE